MSTTPIPRPIDLAAALGDPDSAAACRASLARRPLHAPAARPLDGFVLRLWRYQFRPQTTTLRTARTAIDSTLILDDVRHLMRGDLLRLASGERVRLIAWPDLAAGTVAVHRGAEGTAPAPQPAGSAATLTAPAKSGGPAAGGVPCP
jgi:hypothetical protein